jgi:plasmid stabilization system protein ParE
VARYRLTPSASQDLQDICTTVTARVLIEGRYIVIYEPKLEGVLVGAIVHGMRDPEHWL